MCIRDRFEEGHQFEQEQLRLLEASSSQAGKGCAAAELSPLHAVMRSVESASVKLKAAGQVKAQPSVSSKAPKAHTSVKKAPTAAAPAQQEQLTANVATTSVGPQFQDWSGVLWSSLFVTGGAIGFQWSRSVQTVMLGSMLAGYVVLALSLSGFKFGLFLE
eukprot:TRINITY_DN36549_c0_g1_i1.p1 TRINITY_DN36549_c0_g1~~TRINITY_DN36549_c0_g1_i1.p1  ORF type:complete len:161 (+),score=43.55 TRINITY_DN36549_c0_g1_i1:67-549(+)